MAEKTRYVVLRRVDGPRQATPGEVQPAWQPCGAIIASSTDAARRQFIEQDETLPEGVHDIRAVPERNWGESQSFEVKTKRTVSAVKSAATDTTTRREPAGAAA